MLPFLKNQKEGGAAASSETLKRDPDEGAEYDMLDAVAEDLLAAIESKDAGLLKSALQSLVDHIQTQDVGQDQQVAEEIA